MAAQAGDAVVVPAVSVAALVSADELVVAADIVVVPLIAASAVVLVAAAV